MVDDQVLHNTYNGITKDDEHWLAGKLFELTGIKFRKVKENRFDTDLVSIDHYPEIWVECEGTNASTWPENSLKPNWSLGCTVPIRRHRLMEKVEAGKLAFWIKFNHYRTRCIITDAEIIDYHFQNKHFRKVENTYKTRGMSNEFIRLDWDDVYYGFDNIATLFKRKIYRYKKNKYNRVFEMRSK